MYKFIITIVCQPGTRDRILGAAPAVQAATRADPGCHQYEIFSCTDDPDKLVFVEAWTDEAAHAFHMEQDHTRRFIAFHEPFHRTFLFETIHAET